MRHFCNVHFWFIVAVLCLFGAQSFRTTAAEHDVGVTVEVVNAAGEPLPAARVIHEWGFGGSRVQQQRDLETGDDGRVSVTVDASSSFAIQALFPGLAPLRRFVSLRNGESPPESIRFTLREGMSIGGRVVDKNGRGVEGARVQIQAYGENNADQTQVYLREHVESTDGDGRWRCIVMPDRPRSHYLFISHPDHLARVYAEGTNPPLGLLQSGNWTYALPSGNLRVGGIVVDEQGRPIAGATVGQLGQKGRYYQWQTTLTAEDGRFRFEATRPGKTRYIAAKAPWAPTFQDDRVDSSRLDLKLALAETGHPAAIRVTDAEGRPVAAATVVMLSTLQGRDVMEAAGMDKRTDDSGMWRWSWAPADPIPIRLVAHGYEYQEVDVLADGSVREFVLQRRPELLVRGRLIDAVTSKPLTGPVRISWAAEPQGKAQPLASGLTLHEGKFNYGFPTNGRPVYLWIEHEGYFPGWSGAIHSAASAAEVEVRLRPRHTYVAVIGPDGQRCVELQAVVCSKTEHARLTNGRLANSRDGGVLETDADWEILVPSELRGSVYIVHALGYAEKKVSDLHGSGQIVLSRWARIVGQLTVAGRPAPGEQMVLHLVSNSPSSHASHYRYAVITDRQGRFEFDRVRPGDGWVSRQLIGDDDEPVFTQTTAVHTEPGHTLDIEIGGSRRVEGRLWMPKAVNDNFLWNASTGRMIRLTDAQSVPLTGSSRPVEQYPLQILPNGEFWVDDVPPGKYQLIVLARELASDRQCGPGQVLASVAAEIDVDDATKPLDLGNLECRHRPRLEVGDNSPDLSIETLSGKPLKLKDLRGKIVFLEFTRSNCDAAMKAQEILKVLHRDLQSGERSGHRDDVVIVSVFVDSLDVAASIAQRRGLQWTIGALRDVETLDQLGISAYPTNFLMNIEGVVIEKNLQGQMIEIVLDREFEKIAATAKQ